MYIKNQYISQKLLNLHKIIINACFYSEFILPHLLGILLLCFTCWQNQKRLIIDHDFMQIEVSKTCKIIDYIYCCSKLEKIIKGRPNTLQLHLLFNRLLFIFVWTFLLNSWIWLKMGSKRKKLPICRKFSRNYCGL